MWLVMKAFAWESLQLEGFPRVSLAKNSDLGERFVPVFDDYNKAKALADKEGVQAMMVGEVREERDE